MTTDLSDILADVARAAAVAASEVIGCGDRDAVDRAAVDALRRAFADAPIAGRIVIGEGEKDRAPMLAAGEHVGRGGPALDIAVDPIDGTRCVAEGRPGGIVAIGAAPRGSMRAPPGFRVFKLATGAASLDPAATIEDALARLARVRGRRPRVAVLDRPRNAAYLAIARAAGADVHLLADADLSATVAAALPDHELDALLGVGGSPEAVVAACAITCLKGQLLWRPWPGEGPQQPLRALVDAPAAWFVAVGVTGSELVAPGETLTIDPRQIRRFTS
ncbi:MAG: fructose-bisphosphatase class II [Myxococcales bacterium]|nr:fructose-bisphosphatase class II [Myxococcales bacterium]